MTLKSTIAAFVMKSRYRIKGGISHLEIQRNIKKKWYGSGYGGFYLFPSKLNENSVIYSFGVGKDISFDLDIIKHHYVTVFGFDPTPEVSEWVDKQELPDKYFFKKFGIGTKSGVETFYLPTNPKFVSGSFVRQKNINVENSIDLSMKSFSDIANELNHTFVDVVKMDIEGSEYEVIPSILESGVKIGQLAIEFHDRFFDKKPSMSVLAVTRLNSYGFYIFGVSSNFQEISFIHESLLD